MASCLFDEPESGYYRPWCRRSRWTTAIQNVIIWMGGWFTQLDARFARVDAQLTAMNNRLAAIKA